METDGSNWGLSIIFCFLAAALFQIWIVVRVLQFMSCVETLLRNLDRTVTSANESIKKIVD